MRKVIFLDFDGVINDNQTTFPDIFNEDSINVLKELREKNDALIVVISSYLQNGTMKRKQKIRDLLEKYDLEPIDFIKPNYDGTFLDISLPQREVGIVAYLKKLIWLF